MIVIISVLGMTLEKVTTDVQAAMALRVLRAIKPLRMLTRRWDFVAPFVTYTCALSNPH